MKRPGGVLLEQMLETAGEGGLSAIGSLSTEDAARVMLACADKILLARTGARVSPGGLRLLAQEGEQLAAEFRRIAAKREREAS